ncbi:MAG: DUF2203 domain-containing protein [Burkholderiales bacterium]|nr:DUF2203 domain-containing protein [Phycisphaerae bacterium]
MAASKSWSTDVTLTRRRRHFTVAEANRTLPLVRRVVADIVRTHERATDLHNKLEDRACPQKRADVEESLEKQVDLLADLVEELRSIGCDLKDYRMGLVDFIGKHQGREICLCWKMGEEQVDWWHELHTGFSGRQPVSLLT